MRTGREGWQRISWAIALWLCSVASFAHADARTEFLERMLSTSDQFRVRAQAALALGHATGDPTAVAALRAALRDEHPAVRSSAAASLEQLGDPSALPDLQRATSDSDNSVRRSAQHAVSVLSRLAARPTGNGSTGGNQGGSTGGGGPASYYIGIGMPSSRAGVSPAVLARARDAIVQNVTSVSGVRVAPPNESNDAARRVISAGHLKGFYLDSTVTTVETRPDGSLHAAVSIVIQTYPGRDIKTILNGGATVSGGGDPEGAIDGAFQGALRSLSQALAMSAGD